MENTQLITANSIEELVALRSKIKNQKKIQKFSEKVDSLVLQLTSAIKQIALVANEINSEEARLMVLQEVKDELESSGADSDAIEKIIAFLN